MVKKSTAFILSALMALNMISADFAGSTAFAYEGEIVISDAEEEANLFEDDVVSEGIVIEDMDASSNGVSIIDDDAEVMLDSDGNDEKAIVIRDDNQNSENNNNLKPLEIDENATITQEGEWDNYTYQLYSDGLLYIRGSGNLEQHVFSYYGTDEAHLPPWSRKKENGGFVDQVKKIKVNAWDGCKKDEEGNIDKTYCLNRIFGAFEGNATVIDLTECDLHDLESTQSMFYGCKKLKTIIWPQFGGYYNVTNMKFMFAGCESLETIDLSASSGFDVSHVVNMNNCFEGCTSLKKVLFGDTSKAEDMSYMFEGCTSLKADGIVGLKTDSAEILWGLFKDCKSLDSFDVSVFNTKNVKTMGNMFYGCEKLREIHGLDKIDISNLYNAGYMFANCTSLENLDLSGFCFTPKPNKVTVYEYDYVGKITNFNNTNKSYYSFRGMFYGCEKLKTLDISDFDLSESGKHSAEDLLYKDNNLAKLTLPPTGNYKQKNEVEGSSEPTYIYLLFPKEMFTADGTSHSASDTLPKDGNNKVVLLAESMIEKYDGAEINYRGAAVAYVKLTDEKGIALPEGTSIYYYRSNKVNGNNKNVWETIVGKEGYTFIYSDLYQYVIPGENNKEFMTGIFLVNEDTNSQPYDDTKLLKLIRISDIKVNDLSYSESWKGKVKLGGEVKAGYSVEAALGPVDAEASLFEAKAEGSIASTVEAVRSRKNGVDNLFLSQAYDLRVGAKGEIGPSIEAKLFESDDKKSTLKASLSLAKANVGTGIGVQSKMGLNIDDFNLKNKDQLIDIGEYLFAVYAFSSGNEYLVELYKVLGIDLYNYRSASVYLNGEAGMELLKGKVDSDLVGTVGGTVGGGVFDTKASGIVRYDWIWKDNNEYEKKYTQTTNTSLNVFSIEGQPKLKTLLGENSTLTYKGEELKESVFKDKNKTNYSFSVSGNGKEDGISKIEFEGIGTSAKDNSIKLNYTDEEAAKIVEDNPSVQNYYGFKMNNYNFVPDILENKRAVGQYSVSEDVKHTITFESSFGAVVGVGGKIKTGLEAEYKRNYDIASGEYKYIADFDDNIFVPNNTSMVVNEITYADNDAYYGVDNDAKGYTNYLEDCVEEHNLQDLFEESLNSLKDILKENIISVKDEVVKGVENGFAKIKANITDPVKKWFVHIETVKKKRDKNGVPEDGYTSYDIFTYNSSFAGSINNSGSEQEGIASTVGDAYIIYVTDDTDNNVDDWAGNKLTLELSYEDEMLTAAGATVNDADSLAIYLYSEDKLGYLYKGGKVDTVNKTVTLDITEEGQYILAIDTKAPSVTNLYLTDDSRTPTIVVAMDEMSDLKEFSLTLDDKVLVNKENYYSFYKHDTQTVEYQIHEDNKLSYGKHVIKVYAADAKGNAMPEPKILEFIIPLATTDIIIDKTEANINVDEYLFLNATILPKDATYQGITWSSSDEKVASVNKNGAVIGIGKGTAIITATAEKYNFTASCTVTVSNPNEFGDVLPEDIPEGGIPDGLWGVTVKNPDSEDGLYYYTGKAIKPEIRVYEGKKLLKAGKDYTLKYANNIKAYRANGEANSNAKTPCVTITGKGNYADSEKVYFEIMPIDISDGHDYVSCNEMAVIYSKKAQKPLPDIIVNNKKIKANSDYTVKYYAGASYKDAENPGTALDSVTNPGDYYARITAKGNYAGSRDVALSVLKDDKSVKLVSKLKISKVADQKYNDGAEIKPSVIVKDGNNTLDINKHYFVRYENNKKAGKGYVIVTGNPAKGYSGSKRVVFNIVGASLSGAKVTGVPDSTEYTGKAISFDKITITPKGSNVPLKPYDKESGKGDFVISYQNNVNSGTATVVFTGVNGGVGTLKKTFKITPYSLKNNTKNRVTVKALEELNVPYTTGGAKPKLVVMLDGKPLTENVDYAVTYKDNKKVGNNAQATIKGKGNFKDSYPQTVTFKVEKADISKLIMSAADKSYQNKKNSYATKVKIFDADGKALKAGTDYEKKLIYIYTEDTYVTLVEKNSTTKKLRKAGEPVDINDIIPVNTTIKVTAAGKGNFYGEASSTYRIMTNNISKAKISVSSKSYTGKAITISSDDVTVRVNGTVVPSVDKTTGKTNWIIDESTYESNLNKGTAKVTIKGTGNYSGSKTCSFKIVSKKFKWLIFGGNK